MRRILISVVLLLTSASAGAQRPDLSGLWQAQRSFVATASRPLILTENKGNLLAEIDGTRYTVSRTGNAVQFATHNERFEGSFYKDAQGETLVGHWLQPRSPFDGNAYATPVRLKKTPAGWAGEVNPQADTATFFLIVTAADKDFDAKLINPERNLGVFQQLTRLSVAGSSVTLHGRFRGRGDERPMLSGEYLADEGVLHVRYPYRGGGYDFRRVTPAEASGFLAAHGMENATLQQPPMLNDGWQTASVEASGLDPAPIRRMIREHILPPPSGPGDLSVHALLLAYNGRLVVEEYFHGYHRDLPHDSRSASKSVTAILAAAAVERVDALNWKSPVYPWFDAPGLVALDARRGAIRLEHLVNMSTGLDCDDRNPQSVAHEDQLWDNADTLDFYDHTLAAPVVHAAGKVAAYCSAGANLVGGVIEAATNQPLLQFLDAALAAPMNIHRYAATVPPDGHPYMGGGMRWLPRDFLKFPQLLLDGGQWNGKAVISAESAKRLLTPEVKIDGGRDYGYFWWSAEYPFRGRTVRAHFMAGNGGQIAMLMPALKLSVAFNAGNYSDRVGFRIQEELIPDYILRAVPD